MTRGDAKATPVLEGTLDRVVYQNDDTLWAVVRIRTEEGDEQVAVGNIAGVQPGTPLLLRGEWVVDKRFGRQFKIDSFHIAEPETLKGIELYLGSGLVPGIGPALAARIVDRFGQKTLSIISDQPEKLTEVAGIGDARAQAISSAWKEQREVQDVMVFLRGHGVSTAFASRIYRRYGRDAIRIVRENPYRLALDIWGIGFKTADSIAQSLGIARDSPERLEAGLLHILGDEADDGNCFALLEPALDRTAELLGVGSELVRQVIPSLMLSGLVVREEPPDRPPRLFLASLHRTEIEAAGRIAELAANAGSAISIDIDSFIGEYQREEKIELAPEQRRAVAACASEKLTIVTGGPGVGKTTIVRAVVSLFRRARLVVSLAAPTGRAAKRLAESTGQAAMTLHRLLDFQPNTGQFERNRERPLELDVLIVDEVSMVDLPLFRSLVAALPDTARLILVGDVDQLPSVGPGAVLADLIDCGRATVVRLVEIFRQAAASRIVQSAHQVNAGQIPDLKAPPGDDPDRSDFYFIERGDAIEARETIVDLVSERIPKRFGFDPITEIQVLTPMHRGDLGTVALNSALGAVLGGQDGPQLSRGQRQYRVGDKVMQLKNDYDKDVYNGDVGVTLAIDQAEQTMMVQLLDGRMIHYEAGELDQIVHAFACSVHKSQGSEYPAVVIPLVTQHYMMLQRTLLYTAITRGKKLVVIVGSSKALAMAVRNQASKSRNTALSERIRAAEIA